MRNPEMEEQLRAVRNAARVGARSRSSLRVVQDDAVEAAVEAWEAAVVRGRPIQDLERWACRVGANAATRFAVRLAARRGIEPIDPEAQEAPDSAPHAPEPVDLRERLLQLLGGVRAKSLSPRMHQIIAKLCEGRGMTLNRATRELCMDRKNVRRSLKRAVSRLCSRIAQDANRSGPPGASME